MISCDECRQKIAAVFDNEASEGDEGLISAHIEDCPDCQAFRAELIKIRQALASAAVPAVSLQLQYERMQGVETAGMKYKQPGSTERASYERLALRFRRLAWAGGLAASFLIVVSWLACFVLSGRVHDLKQKLQVAQQDLAVVNMEKQLAEAQDNQQKAISELHVRVKELEGHVRRGISPRMAWKSESPYYTPERPGKL